ncbi:hypothetical protein PR048_008135 [Dryococelus australis]|uniref:Secreted protein n=1 Tax=Dryococelus australis TaxID=614101 RepID=A0ABQ9HW90_9NEOP|nr:hypothetical protein PR048_008135 [Dryococelus australis]
MVIQRKACMAIILALQATRCVNQVLDEELYSHMQLLKEVVQVKDDYNNYFRTDEKRTINCYERLKHT